MTNKNEQRKVPELRFPEFSGEWEEKKLRQLGKFISGGTPNRKKKEYWNGSIPWITTSEIKGTYINEAKEYISKEGLENSSAKFVESSAILIAMYGQGKTRAKSAILNFPASTNQACGIHLVENNDIRFVYQLYTKNYLKLRELSNNGSQKNLSLSLLSEYTAYIPKLKEQQKIGEFFSKLDRQIELEEKKLALLEEQKKGYMQKIFSQELRFKDENGEEYPEWERVKLVDICNFRRGSFPQPYGDRRWYDSENGKPFVQVFDVDTNMKIKKKTKNNISKIAEAKSVLAKPGNILVTLQGSIGRVAVLEYEAFVDRTLLIINDFMVDIDPDFFKYLLLLKFDEEKRKAPGGTIKTITKEVLSEFKVNLPVFEYQQKIAMIFKDIEERLIRQNKKINLLNERKNNLLNKIFI